MLQHVVCLILVPAVLLTQWLGFGHCHGCHHTPEHDHHPHIHLPWFLFTGTSPTTTARASHDCCHPQDDHDSTDEPVDEENDTTGHGSGAVVYLPTPVLHGRSTGPSLADREHPAHAPTLALVDDALAHFLPHHRTRYAPPSLEGSCRPGSLRTLPILI